MLRMKMVKAYPPNFAKIREAFPTASRMHGVIFCYGDTVYNPGGVTLYEPILAHEAVHSRQQGKSPEAWWDRYIAEPKFRFDQELEAHREEYQVAGRSLTRNQRRQLLRGLAHRLSGPLYGKMVTKDEASRLIALDRVQLTPEKTSA